MRCDAMSGVHIDADDLNAPLAGDAVEFVLQHRGERLLLRFE